MSDKREDYDREHQRTMELIHGGSDLIENFPLNPVEMAREALKNDIERKANKDAYDGRYDPPTKEKEAAARLEAEEFERQQKRKPPSNSGPFSNNDAASSGGDWDWVIKLGFWLAAIAFVIWLVAMAVAVTVVLSPIWLGAVTIGVITGFILAQSASSRISDDALSTVPVVEEQKRKKTRIRVAEEFIQGNVKFTPHLLGLILATVVYGLALAAWPFFMTTDIFTRILLGVGVVAGTILGTMAGRRVLCWQLENSIFARAESENPTRLLAPKLALGLSIPGFVALAGLWIIVLFQSPENLDLAKAFGFKDGQQTRQHSTLLFSLMARSKSHDPPTRHWCKLPAPNAMRIGIGGAFLSG